MARVVARATRAGVAVQHLDAAGLDRLVPGAAHQGVAAEVAQITQVDQVATSGRRTVQDLLRAASAVPLFVVLDGIEDPRNFGAVARAAEAAGVDGLVHQTRRSAPLGATAAKASAGALAHVRVAAVVNVSRALEELRAAGVWTVGLAGPRARSVPTTRST